MFHKWVAIHPRKIFSDFPQIFLGNLLYLIYGNKILHIESNGSGTGCDVPQTLLASTGRESALRMPADWTAQSALVEKKLDALRRWFADQRLLPGQETTS